MVDNLEVRDGVVELGLFCQSEDSDRRTISVLLYWGALRLPIAALRALR